MSNNIGKRKVLLIDDNELSRELLSTLISDFYEISEAENGLQGYEYFQEHYKELSVILLDIQLPVMNGIEFLEKVKEDAILSRVPIIVMTELNDTKTEERCLSLGASDFISKPFNYNIVKFRIENIIKLSESSAALTDVEYDELTGLYTKQAFYHYAKIMMDKNPDTRYDLLISDIMDFHFVNELYGEFTGDQILQDVGRHFLHENVCNVLCGRYGADQFVNLIRYENQDSYNEFIEFLFNYERKERIPKIDLKFGLYENVSREIPVAIICDRAMSALRSVKNQYDKKCGIYNDEILQKTLRKQQLELDMFTAAEDGQFQVYYQPKHDARTKKLIGAEALIRWIHPKFGFLSPVEFIPIFEERGFVKEADFYMWNEVCKHLKKWQEMGIDPVPVSVNFSKLDFSLENFIDRLDQAASKYNISPDYLHIEVTESLLADNLQSIIEILSICREHGFKIELDDFGAGYSSLNVLGAIPLDVLKLDMSFCKQLNDPRKARVLYSCFTLAKLLNLKTVTEGVETEEQLEAIKSMGGDFIQGYYFSKPISEENFIKYMREYSI